MEGEITEKLGVKDEGDFWLSVLHAFLFAGALFCAAVWYGPNVYLSWFLFFISCVNLILSMMNMVSALRPGEDLDL